jgi:hypothetical protein
MKGLVSGSDSIEKILSMFLDFEKPHTTVTSVVILLSWSSTADTPYSLWATSMYIVRSRHKTF